MGCFDATRSKRVNILFLGMARHGFLVVVKNIFSRKGSWIHSSCSSRVSSGAYGPGRPYFDVFWLGKHFLWTSLHVLWAWALLLDLITILLEMATLLLDLHTLLLDLILPSCSTWPFPKPYPFWIDPPVSVQPRLHRNFSDSRALELR